VAHAGKLTNLNLFCYFSIFIQKTCFRRLRKACLTFSVVSREKRIGVLTAIFFTGIIFLAYQLSAQIHFGLNVWPFVWSLRGKQFGSHTF